ncbi:Uncharacterized conserved protein, contains NRDE domain [Melghirimyces thermohalophilus]|uniref:Uncharacterized conserved protein, contains NRDE domain n=1 Tax=Melghirimyces thermohalophilus TaxID=1236220 RepID=A0A1G6K3K6_9BACL|nr:NRDE family protein [Melghirimyces thermohalophilus]SDC24866.1 Uncharacterized conserved protein, contains NRDE domain [Melghirimyces thermohalophilus]
MCLILFSFREDPQMPLVMAANRDEFRERPTEPAHFWPEAPQLLAGRDRIGGGTWMGVTRAGRFAALTNYREPEESTAGKRSRGVLVRDYLMQKVPPRQYLAEVAAEAQSYAGFNLLVGDREQLWYYSNRQGEIVEVQPGIHGLSNALLDTPWPKVERGKEMLSDCGGDWEQEALFQVLADADPAPDHTLPDTGVGLEMERGLSSIWIDLPGYGTRSSTILTVDNNGQVGFVERTFSGEEQEDRLYRFTVS